MEIIEVCWASNVVLGTILCHTTPLLPGGNALETHNIERDNVHPFYVYVLIF